ncbi:MAG: lysylphosphatidylglycerol synthase transmembrane domain-containing protein [Candidatus Bathyarchaeota archaeon]|nr:lysylphosphatidylglycerol synthase transmembrane domain-containing protein [Candidatus Bathyarchaeota archaeon]
MTVKYNITWKTGLFIIVGLLAFVVYILVYMYMFNADISVVASLQRTNLAFFMIGLVAVLLDTLFFTLAWHSLLRFLSVKISVGRTLLYVLFGTFVDILVPAESLSGEISKVYLVTRDQEGSMGKATASLVVQRLIGMAINIATLLAGAALLLVERLLSGTMLVLILALVGLTFVFLLLLLLLCVKEKWTLWIVSSVVGFVDRITKGHWKLSKVKGEMMEAAKIFHCAMKEFARAPKTVFIASFFSAMSWVLVILAFYLSFMSVGYTAISWSVILVICSVFAAVKSIPVGIPFEVGIPEMTLFTLFVWFGVPAETSFTVTVILRLLTLWFKFILGFAAQQWLGIKAITTLSRNETADSGLEKT